MREMGWTEAACVLVDVTDHEATRLGLALNRTAELADWDVDTLGSLIDDVEEDLDPDLWSDDEVDQLLAELETPADVEDVAAPELPDETTTEPGDVWVLGDHRLICGDASDDSTWQPIDDQVDLLVTDPPYGVSVGEKNRWLDETGRAGERLEDLWGDEGGIEEWQPVWVEIFSACHDHMADGAPFYVFCAPGVYQFDMHTALTDAGLNARHQLVWVKNNHVLGRCDYHYKHEPILYGWDEHGAHPWYADRSEVSVLEYDKPQASKDHPTTKPTPLIAHLIQNSTKQGQHVLDPFSGIGTSILAAEQLDRACTAIEVEPRYCDVAVDRWETYTGEEAHRV